MDSMHKHYGVDNKHHICITKHGPVWFNEGGLYLYDLENKIFNLCEDKIKRGRYIPDTSSLWGQTVGIIQGGNYNEYLLNEMLQLMEDTTPGIVDTYNDNVIDSEDIDI